MSRKTRTRKQTSNNKGFLFVCLAVERVSLESDSQNRCDSLCLGQTDSGTDRIVRECENISDSMQVLTRA
jgi:hypothetical protein